MPKRSDKPAVRKAAVAGSFYPRRCREVEALFHRWNTKAQKWLKAHPVGLERVRAIVVPHAGYIYSGYTADLAYRVASRLAKPKRVIVVGPSHRYYFEGVSVGVFSRFETPCGAIPSDSDYGRKIAKHFPVRFEPRAHVKEHSTEVQFPFIGHYFPGAKVVEIVYGKVDPRVLAKLLYALMRERENLVVISTDLSHFYTLGEAKKRDNVCLNAVAKRDPALLDRGCEACGFTGLKALLIAVRTAGFRTALLDYRTSADATGDEKRVVGYMSAIAG